MPFFERYEPPRPLPELNKGFERAVIDFKATVADMSPFRLAKYIAAFANHLGGTLLIGMTEKDGFVRSFSGLAAADIANAREAISRAVLHRCAPRPFVDFADYDRPEGMVLAVNVEPMPGQLVGVMRRAARAFVFPVRSGVDSAFLTPEQFPMFMMPEVRRIAILLHSIPPGAEVEVREFGRGDGVDKREFRFVDLDEAKNLVRFRIRSAAADAIDAELLYPLDQVQTVYQKKAGGGWYVAFRQYR